MHEITHVLGFSKSLYSSWPSKPTYKSKVVNGNTITYISANPLTQTIRDHFGCKTAVGAYLENQGASGSIGSHFERRVFFNEFMTASEIKDSRITKFTLALLASTGWYKAVYDWAEPTYWGYLDGCAFLDTKCVNPSTKRTAFSEFCTTFNAYGCYASGTWGGFCGNTKISKAKTLDADINYFGDKRLVLDPYADNCPFINPYSNMNCEDSANQKSSVFSGEGYGYGAKCFMGTLYSKKALSTQRPYCFKYDCVKQKTGKYALNVKIGSKTAVCTAAGDKKVSGYAGILKCPDPQTYCTTIGKKYCKRGCMGNGKCLSTGLCQCNSGWTGADCSMKKTTSKIMEEPVVEEPYGVEPVIENGEDSYDASPEEYNNNEDEN